MVDAFEHLSDQQLMQVANTLMDRLMTASTHIDYAAHTQDFSKRALGVLNQNQFEHICKHYQKEKGFFTQRDCVAIFRRPESIAIIWKQNFSIAQGDFVAEMVIIIEDDCYKVDHVFVF